MNKKGAMGLNNVPYVAIAFLLTAVFFVLSIVVLSAFQDTTVTPRTVVNESFTMTADEGSITLANYRVTSITSVRNLTGALFPAANYTLSNPSPTSSIVTFHENATVCKTGATCRITYDYNTYNEETPVAIENTIDALSEIPNNWLTIIAIVIAISVVIGVTFAAFKGFSGGENR